VIGRCRLCLQDSVVLQDSHILSKGLYRLLRSDKNTGNPNPWIITEDVEVQTSRQERAWLLCYDCEQRLAQNGETWMFRNGLRKDGTFPLLSNLAASAGLSDSEVHDRTYFASSIPKMNVNAIAYFAASIFWRASVHDWNGSPGQVRLGPFEESFRLYLLGLSPFPATTALIVCIRAVHASTSGLCRLPATKRFDGLHTHTFPMPGIAFTMFVSRNLTPWHKGHCIVHGAGNPLIVSEKLESSLVEGAVKALSRRRKK
jgi:hypothetical protein